MEIKHRFIQLPISLLQDYKPEHLNEAIYYTQYAIFNKIDEPAIELLAKSALYAYKRRRSELSNLILRYFEEHEIEETGSDDFNGEGFFPADEEIEVTIKLLTQNQKAKCEVLDLYKLNATNKILRIRSANKADSIKRIYEVGRKYDKPIIAMISSNLIFDFRDNKKSSYETDLFLANIAIRSIIGNKTYKKTTTAAIFTRMVGFAMKTDLDISENKFYLLYGGRRQWHKFKLDLEQLWHINILSYHIRGIYVSIDGKLSLENLALQMERNRMTNRTKKSNDRKRQAIMNAKKKLNL